MYFPRVTESKKYLLTAAVTVSKVDYLLVGPGARFVSDLVSLINVLLLNDNSYYACVIDADALLYLQLQILYSFFLYFFLFHMHSLLVCEYKRDRIETLMQCAEWSWFTFQHCENLSCLKLQLDIPVRERHRAASLQML